MFSLAKAGSFTVADMKHRVRRMVQSSRLLLAEKQGLEQDNDADANQDHGGDDHTI
jgi:hypothetical protein